ncbi:hypothetical protein ACFZBU_22050 [Embleya sp. NPDC008237]|uniref:hypothetical protein n=1 Tax=unclassified Embleya TaxID=2699296 RepID=UPI0036E84331
MSTGNETDERDPYAPPPEGTPDRPPAAPWNVPGNGRGDGGNGGDRHGREDRPQRAPREPREQPDPKDIRVRNGRLALWSGVWAVFFALFLPSDLGLVLGVVLGVVALVLGIRTVRGTTPATAGPRIEEGPGGTARHPGHAPGGPAHRPRVRRPAGSRSGAALAGLVTGAIAVVYVLGVWTFEAVNKDYYDCMDSALTKTGEQRCLDKLPERYHFLVDGTI